MKKHFYVFIVLIVVFNSVIVQNVLGHEKKVRVYVFWNPGCPHCRREIAWMKNLENEYPWLKVKYLNMKENPKNKELYREVVKSYGKHLIGFPAVLIGEEIIFGYDSDIGTGVKIQRKILECHEKGCIDPVAQLYMGKRTLKPEVNQDDTTIELPLFGTVDVSHLSLPLFTVVIGGLDGFNPCAFFVLFFLLSLLIHAQSRGRMFVIGGIFVFFSGFIYFIFMAAWLNLFLIIGQLKIITYGAGIIALIIASLNIKDFFWFKRGVSFVIPESAKPKLFTRMRELVKVTKFSSMLFGTIILAIAANTYELICTAGFPMIYTRVLTLHELSTPGYYGYLALYNIIYVIPLFTIVIVFTLTLGTWKLREETSRTLKLLSGIMMLSLGLVLVTSPDLINDFRIAIGILVFAIGATFSANAIMKIRLKRS